MIYRSNLAPPDMSGFRLLDPPMQNCGHDIPSDPDLDPGCGFMSHDELAILHATLHGPHMHKKTTVDIGARVGWTAKAINAATDGCVICVDPILAFGSPARNRMAENLGRTGGNVIVVPSTAEQFFRLRAQYLKPTLYSAFVIDGDHDTPQPTLDAIGALGIAAADCIMIFHDGRGRPIQDAVSHLMDHGFRARVYWTPAVMFVCWRGFEGWMPPDHARDESIPDWPGIEREMREGPVDTGDLA